MSTLRFILLSGSLLLLMGCPPPPATSSTSSSAPPPLTVAAPDAPPEDSPLNIIFMVGDGMGISQITAGLYSNDNRLELERFPVIGLHKSYSSDNLITDSAAGATAFSAGVKTYNGAIGVDADTNAVKTIMESAEDQGLATGIIATSSVVHATPASFFAHNAARKNYEAIASDFLDMEVDLLIGGGQKFFDRRKEDDLNLISTLKQRGYYVSSFRDRELTKIPMSTSRNFAYFTADGEPLSFLQGRNYLVPAVSKATEYLSEKAGRRGFFLVVEGSQIDWGGHDNDSDYIIAEMIEFDRAIGKVLDFAARDGNTLVIVTADHETGGYAINEGSRMGSIVPAFTSDYHTADLIPVFAYGPGASAFGGIYENTAIYDKMMRAFNWQNTRSSSP